MPLNRYTGSINRRMEVRPARAQTQDPKITKAKRTGGIARVVKHLSSKHNALS
jgi:hypothetical protein